MNRKIPIPEQLNKSPGFQNPGKTPPIPSCGSHYPDITDRETASDARRQGSLQIGSHNYMTVQGTIV